MKNSVIIIIGVLLLLAFGMQVFMFYRIHEKLDQRFALEKQLSLSGSEGTNTWVQDSDNWNPYQELLQIRDQMEQMLHDSFSRLQINAKAGSNTKMPALDLKEEPDRYIITVNVPGADESSLDVALDGRLLTIAIRTEHVSEPAEEKNKYQRRERFRGEFKRTLTLPGDVDQSNIQTEYSNGVLTITLAKV